MSKWHVWHTTPKGSVEVGQDNTENITLNFYTEGEQRTGSNSCYGTKVMKGQSIRDTIRVMR